MANPLIWLPDVLRGANLKVALEPGWETRGRSDVGPIFGVICHHTAGGRTGNLPSRNVLVNGRRAAPGVSALAGPLCQLALGRDGTWYVIAAGRANHAGKGIWRGLTNGNTNFIGVEAENTGGANDRPWPEVQMDAYRRGVAAILKHVGRGAEFCCGHSEYALPRGRKTDPSFDMREFREGVAAVLAGDAPPPRLIPAAEAGGAGRPTLRRGQVHDLAVVIQRKLGVAPSSRHFGPKTEAAVRAFQRERGMVPDGIVGPKTWAALDRA